MIIENLYFLDKKDKMIARIISDISMIIVGISPIILNFIIHLLNLLENKDISIVIILCLFGIGYSLIIKFSDVIVKKCRCFGFWFMGRIRYGKKRRNAMILSPLSNDAQRRVHGAIINRETFTNRIIHIYGLPQTGKTTAAFFALEGVLLKDKKWVRKIENILLIDCSIDKEEVYNFFKSDENINKMSENSIVILDNIEQFGEKFIQNHQYIFESYTNLFILVEDCMQDRSILSADLLQTKEQHIFNENEVDNNVQENIEYVANLPERERFIFFAIYLYIYIHKYIKTKEFAPIFNIQEKEVIDFIKKYERKGPFAFLPFNKEYIYCNNYSILPKIPHKYINDNQYRKVTELCLQSDYFKIKRKEGHWICLIFSNPDDIKLISAEDRQISFKNALSNGRYELLYNAINLLQEINKERAATFGYESGVLNYYMNKHKKAAQIHKTYLDTLEPEPKCRVMIRVIEAIHGNSSEVSLKEIDNYIKELRKHPDYKLYANYWETHIGIERGDFNTDRLDEIITQLKERQPDKNDHLYTETIKRYYTDSLRCHYLRGTTLPKELEEEFAAFLNKQSEDQYEYCFNVYVKAAKIQYLEIPEIDYENWETEAPILYQKAEEFYTIAENSTYNDPRNRRTMHVKWADLKMIFSNPQIIEECIETVQRFLFLSNKNEIDVHEAFAHTMLAKFKLLQHQNFFTEQTEQKREEIFQHFEKAHTLYQQYNNQYGVFRIEFMMFLYELKTGRDQEKTLQKMGGLVSGYRMYYQREYKIWEDLQKKYPRIPYMVIDKHIKTYMIPLQ